jgi:enoyl-CoA hydratase
VIAALSRPEARNAIDAETVGELHQLCRELEEKPQVLILTGTGNTFAAGADIRQLRDRRNHDALAGINSGIFDRIAALPMPTIAAVNGAAIGGGAELAYACDLRVASTAAKFGQPEVQLGIMAAAGGAFRLRELVGLGLAREMLYAGRILTADEAERVGLVSRLSAPEDLMETARQLAAKVNTAAPLALRLTKLALAVPREAHPVIDNIAQAVLFETEEKVARMTKFLERAK